MNRSADVSAAILVQRQNIDYLGAISNQRRKFNVVQDLHDRLLDYTTDRTLVTIKTPPKSAGRIPL